MGERMGTVRVKICGLTNVEDALAAAEAGADLLGFVFYQPSPRNVRPEQAAEIMTAVRADAERRGAPPPRMTGLFVDAPLAVIEATRRLCDFDLIQMHGDEPPHLLEQLRPRAFKALRPTSLEEATIEAEWYADLGPAEGPQLLLDAFHPHLYGGAGQLGDWTLAAALTPRYRILLAGGLNPENVRQAVRQTHPWGVDVSSGVERTPGRKDHDKMRRFIAEARL